MAKTRAQRKAERRARDAQQARQGGDGAATAERPPTPALPASPARARQAPPEIDQADPAAPVPELEAPAGETAVEPGEVPQSGVEDLIAEAPSAPEDLPAPAPSRADAPPAPAKPSRRERRLAKREEQARTEASARRREAMAKPDERDRNVILAFLASCWAELKKVQWPNRETLIQASAVTLVFVAICAAYLGALDAMFNFLVKRIL